MGHFVPSSSVWLLSFAIFCGTSAQARGQSATSTSIEPASSVAELQKKMDRVGAEQVLPSLTRLASEVPPPAGAHRVRGAALYTLNRFPEADDAFRLALIDDPSDVAAMQLRGLTLYRLGKMAEAIPLLERASNWNGETRVDPHYVLALCYLEIRRYDDARHAFAAQYGFAPDSAPAHLLMARMLLRRDFVPESQTEARRALELDPALPMAHLLLGEVALVGEHLDEALAEFDKEVHRDPLFGGVYDRLGDTYARKGDFVRAQQALERALLLEPTTTAPYILLGKVLLKEQDAVSATGYLERAEKMDPANSMTHFLLSQAYRSSGRTEEARREAELVQKLRPETAAPAPTATPAETAAPAETAKPD